MDYRIESLLLYYITDRKQLPGSPAAQRRALLARIAAAARAGADYIQVREKDLSTTELERLAEDAVTVLDRLKSEDRRLKTRFLINSRTDVALACGADGVHLPAGDLPASEVRALVAATRNSVLGTRYFSIAVSCHSAAEVQSAYSHGADFVVFGPVFEKSGKKGVGLKALAQACKSSGPVPKTEGVHRSAMPVLALGGVTLANAAECLRAGAAGVAGIRLFQEGDVAATVAQLRELHHEEAGGAPALRREELRARPTKLTYKRRLPHLQKPGHALFVSFKTYSDLKLNDACRSAVLEHCLHDHNTKLLMHAAVIMPNHVHLLFTPLEDALGDMFGVGEIVGAIKRASAHTVNHLLKREGAVWQDEWFDHRVRSESDFEEKLQYIELNPVEAHLARTPAEYRWLWREEP